MDGFILMCIVTTKLSLLFGITPGEAKFVTKDWIGWKTIGEREYLIFNGTHLKNHETATKMCGEFDANLAIVDTDDIQEDIVRILKEINSPIKDAPLKSYFIGLRDYTGGNSNFVWANGELLHFLPQNPMHWAEGEPDNRFGVDEDCVAMGSYRKTSNYEWFDVPCGSKRLFVCQRYTKEAIGTVEIGAFIVNTGVVIIIFVIVFVTGVHQRRKIYRVLLVPSGPYEEKEEKEEVGLFRLMKMKRRESSFENLCTSVPDG